MTLRWVADETVHAHRFYLEALGFSNTAAAILILVTGAGFACGSLIGGVSSPSHDDQTALLNASQ